MKKQSEFLKLKSKDFWKGLVMAILSAAFTALTTALGSATGFDTFNWQMVVLGGVSGFAAYMLKNFFTNSDGEILKTEN